MKEQVSISNKPLMPSTRSVEDTYPAQTPAPLNRTASSGMRSNTMARLTDRQVACLDDLYANPGEPQHTVYRRHYAARGNSAKVNVSRLLAKPGAQAYLDKKRQAAAERTTITEDQVLARYWQLADWDLVDILNEHGDIKTLDEIPPAARRAITSITRTNSGTFRLTFANRMVALDRIVDMLGFGAKAQEGSETSMLQELFSFVQQHGTTGQPGTLEFDLELAKHSNF